MSNESTQDPIMQSDQIERENLAKNQPLFIVGLIALIVAGISPLFKWISILAGGFIGFISPIGKIIMACSFILAALTGFRIKRGFGLLNVCILNIFWGALLSTWMVGMISFFGSILQNQSLAENPFAGIFATQVGAGNGLYIGLISGISIVAAFIAVMIKLPEFKFQAKNMRLLIAPPLSGILLGFALLKISSPMPNVGSVNGNNSTKNLSLLNSGDSSGGDTEKPRPNLIKPTISNKRFDDSDTQEYVWFDITWDASELAKPIKAIKGALLFTDLFGDTKQRISWTIVAKIEPSVPYIEKGHGFRYNKFNNGDQWVRSTDIKNMKLRYEVDSVLYADGTREDWGGKIQTKTPASDVLIPNVSNKRLDSSDYQDFIWFDVKWDTSKLPKSTRAVKGRMIFSDLFGEPNFRLNWSIDEPMEPGKPYLEQGVGFKYNQFMNEHQWIRNTELNEMIITFEAQAIIFSDGTEKKFDTSSDSNP